MKYHSVNSVLVNVQGLFWEPFPKRIHYVSPDWIGKNRFLRAFFSFRYHKVQIIGEKVSDWAHSTWSFEEILCCIGCVWVRIVMEKNNEVGIFSMSFRFHRRRNEVSLVHYSQLHFSWSRQEAVLDKWQLDGAVRPIKFLFLTSIATRAIWSLTPCTTISLKPLNILPQFVSIVRLFRCLVVAFV